MANLKEWVSNLMNLWLIIKHLEYEGLVMCIVLAKATIMVLVSDSLSYSFISSGKK